MGVMTYSPLAGGWLSGRWRKGSDQPGSTRAARLPERFDLSVAANQRKLDATEQLAELADEAGISLIQIAIAFVLNHPAVTAAIIGPRTMEHLESSSPPRTSSSTRRCSTASTRSSRPPSTSTPPVPVSSPAGRTWP
jgi:aryl-alcohol dehydrogenase-like predicted oxidoreductase